MQWDYDSGAWTYSYGDSRTTLGPDSETMASNATSYIPSYDPKAVDSSYVYTGMDSNWYSSSLYSDGSAGTSYDYSYRNSYSYDNDVMQWDYSTSSWTYSYGDSRSTIVGVSDYDYSPSYYDYYYSDYYSYASPSNYNYTGWITGLR